jgi:Protein of unknown function (DUF4012)
MSADDEYEPRRSLRGPIVTAITFTVLLLLVGLIWIAVTGLLARHDTDAVRFELTELKSDLTHGNDTNAAQLVTTMQQQAKAAHSHTSGPAWWVAAKLPWVGSTAQTVRGATAIVDQLSTQALPPALQAGQLLNPKLLRSGPDQIDPKRLAAAAAPLAQAAQATGSMQTQAQSLSDKTLIGKVNSSRDELVDDVTKFHRAIADLATAAKLLPGPLGQTGPKRYLMVFQTDAEIRGLGGLPGNYAVLSASHGQLHFDRFGADYDLVGTSAHVNLGADYAREFRTMYGALGPEKDFRNANPSPNFPYAAQLWMSMYENKFHQNVDGVIATDPAALGYLLGATGGVTLSDGMALTAANAVSFFENGVYSKFPPHHNLERKRYQNAAAQAVATKVLHEPSNDLLNTATALQKATDEGRLLIYTADASVEASLAKEPLGGVLPETTRPFLGVILNSVAANKIGYYVTRTVTYRRASCAASNATVTVTLHNAAPKGIAPYVAGGFNLNPSKRGSTIYVVSLYGTDGSTVSGLTLDGTSESFRTETERGHPVAQVTPVSLAAGQTRTLVFTVKEPAATGPLIALRQPGVNPLTQTISMPNCAA